MARVKFDIKLIGSGDPKFPNIAGVNVPVDVVQALGGRGRIPVKGTINGFAFRTTICVMSGQYFFCVNRQMREGGGGVGPGDRASFVLANDNEERTVTLPPDLAKALGKRAGARAAFDAMSYTHRKEFVLAVNDAKKPETRARRIEKTVKEVLAKRKKKVARA